MVEQQHEDPSSSSSKRKELVALDLEKKSLESEAEAIIDELTSAPPGGGAPMGIDTPLVDDEGYPRADIDVYRARFHRKRLKEIKTDRAELLRRLDVGLVELASLSKSSAASTLIDKKEQEARSAPKPKPKFDPISGKWVVKSWDGSVAGVEGGGARSFENLSAAPSVVVTVASGGPANAETPMVPFAIIDEVSPGSPAYVAGLQAGDLLTRFGSVNSTNHRELRAVAEIVPAAAGERRGVPIEVTRTKGGVGNDDDARTVIKMILRPEPWEGRGLLGCRLKKYDTAE